MYEWIFFSVIFLKYVEMMNILSLKIRFCVSCHSFFFRKRLDSFNEVIRINKFCVINCFTIYVLFLQKRYNVHSELAKTIYEIEKSDNTKDDSYVRLDSYLKIFTITNIYITLLRDIVLMHIVSRNKSNKPL